MAVRAPDRGLPSWRYQEYIASPAWQAQKNWWRRRRPHRRRCQVCGSRHYDLHHRTYIRLGCERLRDLVPLCHRHHTALHDLQARTGWSVEKASRVYLRRRRLLKLVPVLVVLVAFVVLFLM